MHTFKHFQLILIFLILLFSNVSLGQETGEKLQTVRGQVLDQQSQYPLIGASVLVLETNPPLGGITDINGYFKIEKVPVGVINLRISYLGYEEQVIPNVQVTIGKQTSLQVALEETTQMMEEIVVDGTKRTYEELNSLATLSVTGFNIAETERFAGSLGDPARMAANFAGISGVNDGRNDIIIRGNSPTGLLWRMEGVDIPSPNHYSGMGTTGGPVTILNNNQLSNSEFYTGAFPSMFGNANSGVFDLKLRNGNFEKHEHLFQIGFNGFELGSEGPFKKGSRASYTINYRYSVPAVMNAMGFGSGTGEAVPYYQDMTFKVNAPTEKGAFSVFGIGGQSHIDLLGSEIETENGTDDQFGNMDTDIYNISNTGVVGMTYLHFFNPNIFFRNSISISGNEFIADLDTVTRDQNLEVIQIDEYLKQDFSQWTLSYTNEFNKKLNSRNTINFGSVINRMDMDMTQEIYRTDNDFNAVHESGSTYLIKAYAAWSHKLNDRVTLNPGLHYLHLLLNDNSISVEPRLGLKYGLNERSSLNAAYGGHSQIQGLSVYFVETPLQDGSIVQTNRDLGLTRSNHFVMGYENNFAPSWRLKLETYYQGLSNVPVESQSSSFSMLNAGSDFGLPSNDSLVNEGTGRNVGLELTLEKYLNDGWYLLSTTTLYDSKYKGSDGVERSTAFSGNFVANLLAGKEWSVGEYKKLKVDLRTVFAGNRRFIPIDVEGSEQSGQIEYHHNRAFEQRYPNYLRMDVRISYRVDMKKVSQEWALDLQNITNQKNVLRQNYSFYTNEIYNQYQLGFWPMLKYRLFF